MLCSITTCNAFKFYAGVILEVLHEVLHVSLEHSIFLAAGQSSESSDVINVTPKQDKSRFPLPKVSEYDGGMMLMGGVTHGVVYSVHASYRTWLLSKLCMLCSPWDSILT